MHAEGLRHQEQSKSPAPLNKGELKIKQVQSQRWAHGKVNWTLVQRITSVQDPHGDHGHADDRLAASSAHHGPDRWRWGRPGSRSSCGGGSHATLPLREGQDQEIQTMGRLDSGCREQDEVPQVDHKQTAYRLHQELHRSKTVRCLDQRGKNQTCVYCIWCGHSRVVEAQADHTFQKIQEESREALFQLVSRDQAIINRLRLEQGTRSFIELLSEVEDQEQLCRTDEMILTSADMQRRILTVAMKTRRRAEPGQVNRVRQHTHSTSSM